MIELTNYGYNESYNEDYEQEELLEGCIPARVIEVHRELFKVITTYGESNARMKGSFYNKVDVAEDFPAVGDFVQLRYNEIGDSQIVRVLPRISKFSRPDYSGHSAGYVKTILEQVVAANFDYVFILASLNYDFNINRILRYITVAWESGGTPIVLLTKADLVEDYTTQLEKVRQEAIGVPVYAVSAVTREGIEQLQEFMEPRKTIVFLGSSGVGKSTMVNALAGEEIMDVSEIRVEDSKGRHTTTHRQLIMLKNGVMIIDTPGMRELGMWNIDGGFGETFSDIEDLFTVCRFSDCTHHTEPGCAIQSAIAAGTLDRTRWKNYLQLKGEARFTEDKSAYLREKREFFKKLEKSNRVRQKVGGKR